jgi:GcrA cell cycle regulator
MLSPSFSWTDVNLARGRELWQAGFSSSQIATELGCTRNAVIGKVHRQGWSRSGARGTPKPRQRSRAPVVRLVTSRNRGRRPATAPSAPAPLAVIVCEPKGILDIGAGECRYAVADDPFRFCAAPVAGALRYCADHARLSYQPIPARRRDPAPFIPRR